jgi:hypothetical protein
MEVRKLNACELTATVSAIAIGIAGQLTENQLALTAAVLTQIGDTLNTILLQREQCEKTGSNLTIEG